MAEMVCKERNRLNILAGYGRRWAPLGVLIVATALRLWGLGRESLWLDEVTSLMLARMPIPELVAWTAADIHPPLYYLLLHFWRLLGEGRATLRLLSVLGGVLGVALTYLLAHRLFDRRAALAAGLLLAVSPLHIWYSQELRGYAWLTAFSMLALYGLARLATSDRSGPVDVLGWLAYILGAALALWVHYYTVFVILAANTVALLLVLLRRRRPAWLGAWALAQLAVLALFLPWLPTFLKPILTGGRGWVAELGSPGLRALPTAMVAFIVGDAQRWLPVLLRRLTYLAFMAAFALGVLGGAWRGDDEQHRRRRVGILLMAIAFALPLATAWTVSQVKPLFAQRYLLPFLPPFLVLVGRGTQRFRRGWLGALALLLLLVGPCWATAEQVAHQDNPDWRGLAEEIAAQAQPGDCLLLMPGWNAKPLDFYLRGRVPLGDYITEPLDPARTEEARATVRETIRPYRRAWLLWAKGHYTDRQGVVAQELDALGERLQEREVPGVGVLILYRLGGRL